jgi:murein DD-endopeptidase MepM/ murein hydrolase activator NlpD
MKYLLSKRQKNRELAFVFQLNKPYTAVIKTILFVLIFTTFSLASAQAPLKNTQNVEGAARQAGINRLTEKQARGEATSQTADDILITQTQISGDYAFGFIVYQAPDNYDGMPEAVLYVGHWNGSQWDIAVEYTPTFYEWITALPSDLISTEAKATLLSSNSSERKPNATSGLSLPWPNGETWSVTSRGGPHHRIDGFSRPWGAIDFNGGTGSIRSAREGIAWTPCANFIRINHDGNWQTTYYHVRDVAVVNGQSVGRGVHLGWTSMEIGCKGSATGPHVHFAPQYNGADISLDQHIIGGWMILEGNIPYDSGCMERLIDAKRYCVPSSMPMINKGLIGSGYGTAQNAGAWDPANASAWVNRFKSAFNRSPVKGPAVTDASMGVQLFLEPNGARRGLIANVGGGRVYFVGSGLLDWLRKNGYPIDHIVKIDETWYSKNGVTISGPPTTDEITFDGKTVVCFPSACLNYNNGNPFFEGWPPYSPDIWRVDYFNSGAFGAGGASHVENMNLPTNGFSIDWKDKQPHPTVSADYFGVDFYRHITFSAGVYRFSANADDQVDIYIRYYDQAEYIHIVRASDADGQPTQYKDLSIPAGKHRIHVQFRESTGNANLAVSWRFLYRQLALNNGGFEMQGENSKEARYWKHGDLSVAKRVTDGADKAVMLKSGDGNNVSQKIEPPNCEMGQSLKISAVVRAENLKSGAMFRAKYTFLNGTKDKLEIPIDNGTYGYKAVEDQKLLSGTLKKLKLMIIGGSNGKVYVDDVRVLCVDSNTREEIPQIVIDGTESEAVELPLELPEVSEGTWSTTDDLIELPIMP